MQSISGDLDVFCISWNFSELVGWLVAHLLGLVELVAWLVGWFLVPPGMAHYSLIFPKFSIC